MITQKAVVFNLGAAFANSGFNSATGVGGSGLTDAQLAALVSLYQVLNALLEAGGWTLPPDPGASGGVGDAVGDATLHTGDATALGVNAGTSITQVVDAKAKGGNINASQDALVANVGLGVGNTGGNVATGVAAGSGGGINSQVIATLAQFLAACRVARSPDGTDKVPLPFNFGGLIARSPVTAEMTDQLSTRPHQTSSDLLRIPRAADQAHPRRQVIGTLTFSFSSANGKTRPDDRQGAREQHRERHRWLLAAQHVRPRAPPLRRPDGERGIDLGQRDHGTPPDPSTFQADVRDEHAETERRRRWQRRQHEGVPGQQRRSGAVPASGRAVDRAGAGPLS